MITTTAVERYLNTFSDLLKSESNTLFSDVSKKLFEKQTTEKN